MNLENLTVKELQVKAKEAGLSGYSKLKKAELINLIQGHLDSTQTENEHLDSVQIQSPQESPEILAFSARLSTMTKGEARKARKEAWKAGKRNLAKTPRTNNLKLKQTA